MKVEEIGVEQASAGLDAFYVIDVRSREEFDGPLGHVPGSRCVPLEDLEQASGTLPTDVPILIACRSGRRSAIACERLDALTPARAVNLAGGMIAWNEAGLPTEGSADAPSQD